jgi:hypothetical protein
MAARLVVGPHVSDEAISLSRVIVQASGFVEDEQQKRLRVEGYQRRMPDSAANMELQVQQIRDSGFWNDRHGRETENSQELWSARLKLCQSMQRHSTRLARNMKLNLIRLQILFKDGWRIVVVVVIVIVRWVYGISGSGIQTATLDP